MKIFCKCGCGELTSGIWDRHRKRYPLFIRNHNGGQYGFLKGYSPWNKGKEGYTNNGSYKEGELAINWSGFKKGNISWSKGLKRPDISILFKGKRISPATEFKEGKDHPAWKGGITSKANKIRNKYRKELSIWRINIYERDNYICQICGKQGGNLHADHIKPFAYFPKLRLDLNNGRTLCVKCHRKTDSYGGNVWKNYKSLNINAYSI